MKNAPKVKNVNLTKLCNDVAKNASGLLLKETKRQEAEYLALAKSILRQKKQLLFIGGPAYSGTSQLTNKLKDTLSENGLEVVFFELDDFVINPKLPAIPSNINKKRFNLFLNEFLINKFAKTPKQEQVPLRDGQKPVVGEHIHKYAEDTVYIILHRYALMCSFFDELVEKHSFKLFVYNKYSFALGKKKITPDHIRTLRQISKNRENKKFKIAEFLKQRELDLEVEKEYMNANFCKCFTVYNSGSLLEPFVLKTTLLLNPSEEKEKDALTRIYSPLEFMKTDIPETILSKYL
ncbi:MAG: hypothetical protein FWD89_04135 [Firmicutes bacterium]|nr:hypothetical protein [Bacillota bacterium]